MNIADEKKTDKEGYNEFYKASMFSYGSSKEDFEKFFKNQLKPFYQGGSTKGYVRGLATNLLMESAIQSGKNYNDIVVLDAGCGLGGLSAYLALQGFTVVGIDISNEACAACESLTEQLGVRERCNFYPTSLENIPLQDTSVDFVIGHASLHHFIKYEGVPGEFDRVLKTGGEGFFADSFGENKLYSIFHDKDKMRRLGDVSLTKDMVMAYFSDFNSEITPTDWFVMLDKLYLKLFPSAAKSILLKFSKLHFWLDRKIPVNSRLALRLSGSILTKIVKK